MTQPSPTPAGLSTRRLRQAAAYAGIATLAAGSALVVAGAQRDPHTLVPAADLRYPGWLHGPLAGFHIQLGTTGLAWLLVAMCAGYVVVLATADAIRVRVAVGAIVGLHALFMLAPPLLSSDVFGYVDLARLGALHDINPFSPSSTHVPADDVHLYRRWGTDLPSPYGPVFVLLGYLLVPLGVAGALWAFKVLVAVASLAVVWLVWRCAAALGRDPLKAALFVGLNPVLLLFAVGGAHNDFFALVAVMGAVYLLVANRERLSGAALVAAAAVKIPLGLPFLFALARPRADRRGLIGGAAAALVAVVAVSLAAFGSEIGGFLSAVRQQQHDVAIYSVPNQVGELLGLGGITGGIRVAGAALLIATAAHALRRTWRGGDWVAAAGWATFALLVTSAWLLPWYVTWLLPLAAIAGDRRLRVAALALSAYLVATRLAIWT
ncbi:MAG: alpha,6-mannosyltransferase [Thermoleophilaceae bacterium]|nr:alpha,6-mannosyltransferase [Thermoleophilaceae bacterium]